MASNSSLNSSALRILFADDDEAMTLTFGWMLEALGHDVRVARDGLSAIEAARSFMPQVLMLDLNMPGMNGYEICRALRAEPEFEKVYSSPKRGGAIRNIMSVPKRQDFITTSSSRSQSI